MLEHLFDQQHQCTETDASYTFDLYDEYGDSFNLKQETEKRIRYLQSADPDPYGLHNIPIETRLVYMEHYLITGNYLI